MSYPGLDAAISIVHIYVAIVKFFTLCVFFSIYLLIFAFSLLQPVTLSQEGK